MISLRNIGIILNLLILCGICHCQRFGQRATTLFRAPDTYNELRTQTFHRNMDFSGEISEEHRVKRAILSNTAKVNTNFSSVVSIFSKIAFVTNIIWPFLSVK